VDATPPDSPRATRERIVLLTQLGMSRYTQGQFAETRKLYEGVLDLAPDHAVALNNLAFLLMSELNDPTSARPYAERAVERRPEDPGVLDTLGWNLVLLKEYDEAIRRLRHALEMESETAEIHYHAAEAFFRRSSTPGAKREADLEESRVECQRAHELLVKQGQDPSGILDDVVALGEKLGLTLARELPAPAAPAAASP
jgi:tetratricopeptide (TPR) repeat protein